MRKHLHLIPSENTRTPIRERSKLQTPELEHIEMQINKQSKRGTSGDRITEGRAGRPVTTYSDLYSAISRQNITKYTE